VNCYECIDLNKSNIKYKTYRSGTKSMRIVDLYLDSEKVGASSIFRLKEKNGYTIVTKEFKDKCGSFNGLHFQEINF
ncbi:imm11 family protein, partial [Vibrio rotiferianus]